MRIVIDMQGAQSTGSRNRGIGRYTMSLAQGIARNRGTHEVVLALNGAFPETVESIRAEFRELIPQKHIRLWYPTGASCHSETANDWSRHSSEMLREAFISSLKPDLVLVASLFEGLGDNAVTSIGSFAREIPTAVVLYDLIPLIYRNPYLENPAVERWYEEKLVYLRRADMQLAISESSRQESLDHLHTEAKRVVNISTAADPQFSPAAIAPETREALRKRYGLSKPYVMYTGGIDYRKNIEGLISAYAKLPTNLRRQHQLAVICSLQPSDTIRLEAMAVKYGLGANELVLTGFVPEDDLIGLYNLCKVFVFPSWHEGFGLPALEAMACGRAVIGSNRSSLPEVIGRPDALFDPHDVQSVANKLQQVLTDTSFRQTLERHGIEQAARFSWDNSANLAIAALERCHERKQSKKTVPTLQINTMSLPRLAYVSPLPPERSGIADYSADLLPVLGRYYEIEVIVAQHDDAKLRISNYPSRSVEWFRANHETYDRVLYHFGNSSYHQHMFALLEQIPGVVVLHDFFLSNIVAHMEFHGIQLGMWVQSLYAGHGYAAVQHRFSAPDTAEVVWKYPCNHGVLQNAHGVIVHSEHSRQLAKQWYGEDAGHDWQHIPLLRTPVETTNELTHSARKALGLRPDQYVVCSFGMLGPTKLNHRLLNAWLKSPLAHDARCVLVFVGENVGGEYGAALRKAVVNNACKDRIMITGWVEATQFKNYLHAADVGVQLRTLSRGETSAAVLDCMNHGLATIVNANGSMADLPEDGVWKLRDDFSDEELAEALTALYRGDDRRRAMGKRAQEIIRKHHEPDACAARYAEAIETIYHNARTGGAALVDEIARLKFAISDSAQLRKAAEAIDRSITQPLSQKQLFVDISEFVQRDARTGIQRVVRNVLKEWLLNPPTGYRIEPVYASENEFGYRYAREFTLNFLDCRNNVLKDEIISYKSGDIFIGLDLQPVIVPLQHDFFQAMRRSGVIVRFLIYDLLPIKFQKFFSEGALKLYNKWLNVIVETDGAICISKSVAGELKEWIEKNKVERKRTFKIDWFHLGADVVNSTLSTALPPDANHVLERLQCRDTFLMVGTLEPRKGHAQVLDAFEVLWEAGADINLVIVGKQGWMVDRLTTRIRTHGELNQRLFWLEGISDEYLKKVYAVSSCLIAASHSEGFGLPLIEAAQYKLPIIARDIPVFREVAGDHAYYFDGTSSVGFAHEVKTWIELYHADHHPKSDAMPWLTWRESAARLMEHILERSTCFAELSHAYPSLQIKQVPCSNSSAHPSSATA